eukprot:Skav208126  [mRNA]  locus=scaffold1223:174906:177410:- [translate_table: standard]
MQRSQAMRFGYAVRQAEIRHQGLVLQELESLWMRPAVSGRGRKEDSSQNAHQTSLHSVGYPTHGDKDQEPSLESDSVAAHRSLHEVSSRLKRMGEAKPGLATCLPQSGHATPTSIAVSLI